MLKLLIDFVEDFTSYSDRPAKVILKIFMSKTSSVGQELEKSSDKYCNRIETFLSE